MVRELVISVGTNKMGKEKINHLYRQDENGFCYDCGMVQFLDSVGNLKSRHIGVEKNLFIEGQKSKEERIRKIIENKRIELNLLKGLEEQQTGIIWNGCIDNILKDLHL